MEEVQVIVWKLVNLLIVGEPILIEQWKQFGRSLSLDDVILTPLEDDYKRNTITVKELFIQMLQAWVSIQGDDATVGQLLTILRQGDFNRAADNLVPDLKNIYESDGTITDEIVSNWKIVPGLGGSAKNSEGNLEGHPLIMDPSLISTLTEKYKFKCSLKVMACVIICLITIIAVVFLCVKFMPVSDETKKLYSFRNINKKFPIWYNVKEPSYIFKGREDELKSMEISFDSMQKNRELSVVLISGSAFSGRSELARKFAKQLWTTRGVNIFWLNGTNLEPEIRAFMRSQLQLETNSSSFEILNRIQEKDLDPWLMIFDHVDSDESIDCLKAIVQKFLLFSGAARPFVIITTSNSDKLDFLFRQRSARINRIELKEYGSLSQFIKDHVSPWVIEKARSETIDIKFVKSVCTKVDSSFESLEKHNLKSNVATKVSFSLLVLIAHFIGDGIKDCFLVKFWDLSLKEPVLNETLLITVLKSFVDGQVLVNKGWGGFKNKSSSPEVSQVIKDYYLNYSGVNSVVNELLGISSDEISVLRWLMQTLVKYFKIPQTERRNFDEGPHTLKLLNQVTEHNDLVKELKDEIVVIFNKTELNNFWKVEQIDKVYQKYARLFGGLDVSTLQLGNILASTLFRDGLYEESGDLYLQLYHFTGLKFSKYDRKTYEVGDKAVSAFIVAGNKSKAEFIAAEMADVCDRDEYLATTRFEDVNVDETISNYERIYKKCIL